MSFAKKLIKTLVPLLVWIVGADLLGVLVSFFFDVAPLRGTSSALFYAIWLVLGAFVGFLSYNQAASAIAPEGPGDWSARPESGQVGFFVLATFVLFVTALVTLCFAVLWRGRTHADPFVPDSEPLTLVFFAAILIATFIAHSAFRSSPSS